MNKSVEMIEQEHLTSLLKQLAFKINKEIDDSLAHGLIQPEEEVYLRWTVAKFEYTDKGVTEWSRRGDHVTKKSWYRAILKIEESIKKSKEYSSVLEKMLGGDDEIAHNLQFFVRKLVSRRLFESVSDEANTDKFITTFLKELNGEPVKYGAEVKLDGIVIQPERIQFAIDGMNIILRQTTIQDLEEDVPIYGFMQPAVEPPSAILNVEFLGRRAREVQLRVAQALAILRLFKVGGVKYISYRIRSESITDMMASGILTGGGPYLAMEKYLIAEEDAQSLKTFWRIMMKELPRSLYEEGEGQLDHITVAYKRYCDALLGDGVLERRIANAVMGLEGLFLKGREQQELSFRLSIRIAKIFSVLGYCPHEVKEVLKSAYDIRSLFVHGGHLSNKEKGKVASKYGGTRDFLLLVLDYLRISIILAISIKSKKKELLDLIDDSLVDRDKDSQLNNLLSTARKVISGA